MYYLLILLPLVASQVCISDYDCPSNTKCLPYNNGMKSCQFNTVGQGAQPDTYQITECFVDSDCDSGKVCILSDSGDHLCRSRVPNFICKSDKDCGAGALCIQQRCQITVGGVVGKLQGIGGSCRRDADCDDKLNCVDRNGVMTCSLVAGGVVTPVDTCQSSSDCPSSQQCVYRASSGTLVCMSMGDNSVQVGGVVTPQPSVGGNVGSAAIFEAELPPRESTANFNDVQMNKDVQPESFVNNVTLIPTYDVMRTPSTVPKNTIIDPAALPCDYDYQCRMGEACTGLLQMVDRNVTVCQYDVTKQNRTCLYHSDCLHGQLCEQDAGGETFVCRASLTATLGTTPCFFDYECSGGEKCVNIGNETVKQFRCRAPQFADDRRNQRCFTNAECPFQQVCRHVGEVSICVDIGSTVATAQTTDIQKKIVDFVHNLLFARV